MPDNTPLRIAFNIDHFLLHRGGAERYLYDFVMYLLDRGHEVHVFAMDGQDTLKTARFYFHAVPYIPGIRWLRAWSFVINSSSMIRRYSFDIIHVLGKNLTMNVFQPHGGLHRRSFEQNILAFSDQPLIRFLYKLSRLVNLKHLLFLYIEWKQYTLKKLPEYLAISQMVANDIKERFDIPDNKIHLIYNGVDTQRFSYEVREKYRSPMRLEYGVREDEYIVLFVAHNFRLKGLRFFLDACTRFMDKHPDVKLKALIIGKHNASSARMIERVGLSGCCICLNALPQVEKVYACADLLIQPTFYDPCSLVILEALSCGLPAITTQFNGAGELVIHGGTGFIVDKPESIPDIVAGMELFLLKKDANAVARAASDSMKRYDHQKIYAQLESFYYSVKEKQNKEAQ